MRSNSSTGLYPFFGESPTALTVDVGDLWHRRLGHPSRASLSSLAKDFLSCNLSIPPSATCEACQLGRRPRLPFPTSSSFITSPF